MKAILVIDIPDAYADRYNVENMYVWNLVVQDKQGYEMFDLTTDKPSHLKPLPRKLTEADISWGERRGYRGGWNACIDEILSQHVESVENTLEITDEEADCCGVQLWHDD